MFASFGRRLAYLIRLVAQRQVGELYDEFSYLSLLVMLLFHPVPIFLMPACF
jgi:hypothetical protein